MQLGRNGVRFRVPSGGDGSAAPGLPRARAPPGGRGQEQGAGEPRDPGVPPPRPAQRQRRARPRSRSSKYKPGRRGADLAKRPRPRVPSGSLRGWGAGRCPGVGSAVAALAGEAPHVLPFAGRPWDGGAWVTAPPPSPEAPRARARTAGPGRAGEARVIACSGTMPTFEPLTTKQTTLVLSLHCPNKVY